MKADLNIQESSTPLVIHHPGAAEKNVMMETNIVTSEPVVSAANHVVEEHGIAIQPGTAAPNQNDTAAPIQNSATAPVQNDTAGLIQDKVAEVPAIAEHEVGSWVSSAEVAENAVDWSTLSDTERLKAKKQLESAIVEKLSTVFDPEIPVNIYELGLIYEIRIDDERKVVVQMTLTSPACPVAGSLPLEVEEKTLTVEGVASARTELVWEPPWTPDMMSEAAKLELGFF